MRPRRKRYEDESDTEIITSIWTDIKPIASQAAERLGYPTQKPLALLERIINTSSKPGDVVLDPFCGCGTAVIAAHGLDRQWIGIDITYLAIALVRSRLRDAYPKTGNGYKLVGLPQDLASARRLARETEHDGRYQFQFWALSLIGARPLVGPGGTKGKRGADRGIDGVIYLTGIGGRAGRILVQVKSGHVKSGDVRDLRGVLEREPDAMMAVFVTLEKPTREMQTEAAAAGIYNAPDGKPYPRLQIKTIEELLMNNMPQMPSGSTNGGKRAAQAKSRANTEQLPLEDAED
jgi:site-specific DNA-methyltransferase (adenine-specific)